jgi:glucan 1,3-beta-glucosidase
LLGIFYLTYLYISAPALYQKYPTAIDEWTLSEAMAADTSPGGGLTQLETHYQTFIVSFCFSCSRAGTEDVNQTEQDFAEIAGAGLNFVRIPLPYWAIEVRSGEPFLPKTSWTYVYIIFPISLPCSSKF